MADPAAREVPFEASRSAVDLPPPRPTEAAQQNVDRNGEPEEGPPEPVLSEEEQQATEELDALRGVLLHPEAIAEPVREGLFVAIQENRDEVANVIYPVIGPAIRRAAAQALREMVATTNRIINNAVGVQNLKWRIEAARTGRSVADVALAHYLLFRVEQVFLIHSEDGLLLAHVAESTEVAPPEVVSGMLTGIRDFVKDSFGPSADNDDGVSRLQVGDRTVWVEQEGPVTLAAVVLGVAPPDLGPQLRDILDRIWREHGPAIEAFDGDAEPLEDTEPLLRECLVSRVKPPAPRRPWAFLALAALAVLGLLVLGAQQFAWRRQAQTAVDRLVDEPGYQVLQHRTGWTALELTGLKDPLARPLEAVLDDLPIDRNDVTATWAPAQTPAMALTRARRLLAPPASAQFTLTDDGTLVMTGTVAARWRQQVDRWARTIVGIHRVDASGLATYEQAAVRAAIRPIEALRIRFRPGASTPTDRDEIERLQAAVRRLDRAAWVADMRLQLYVEGRADASGPEARNQTLSRDRAEAVVEMLDALALWSIRARPRALGSAEATAEPNAEAQDKSADRAVRFKVERTPAP